MAAPMWGDSPVTWHRAESALHPWYVGEKRAFQAQGIRQAKCRGREIAQGWDPGADRCKGARERGWETWGGGQKAGPSQGCGKPSVSKFSR